MKKSDVLIILIELVLLAIGLEFIIISNEGLNGHIVGNVIQEDENSVVYNYSYIVNEAITEVNSEQRYLDFINQSKYHSVEVKMGEQRFYAEYNSEQGKVVQTGEKAIDFRAKASDKEIDKLIDMYERGNYRAFGMKILSKVPWRVKISLYRQCKATEWCRNEIFGGK
jgi:hypothetical protein